MANPVFKLDHHRSHHSIPELGGPGYLGKDYSEVFLYISKDFSPDPLDLTYNLAVEVVGGSVDAGDEVRITVADVTTPSNGSVTEVLTYDASYGYWIADVKFPVKVFHNIPSVRDLEITVQSFDSSGAPTSAAAVVTRKEYFYINDMVRASVAWPEPTAYPSNAPHDPQFVNVDDQPRISSVTLSPVPGVGSGRLPWVIIRQTAAGQADVYKMLGEGAETAQFTYPVETITPPTDYYGFSESMVSLIGGVATTIRASHAVSNAPIRLYRPYITPLAAVTFDDAIAGVTGLAPGSVLRADDLTASLTLGARALPGISGGSSNRQATWVMASVYDASGARVDAQQVTLWGAAGAAANSTILTGESTYIAGPNGAYFRTRGINIDIDANPSGEYTLRYYAHPLGGACDETFPNGHIGEFPTVIKFDAEVDILETGNIARPVFYGEALFQMHRSGSAPNWYVADFLRITIGGASYFQKDHPASFVYEYDTTEDKYMWYFTPPEDLLTPSPDGDDVTLEIIRPAANSGSLWVYSVDPTRTTPGASTQEILPTATDVTRMRKTAPQLYKLDASKVRGNKNELWGNIRPFMVQDRYTGEYRPLDMSRDVPWYDTRDQNYPLDKTPVGGKTITCFPIVIDNEATPNYPAYVPESFRTLRIGDVIDDRCIWPSYRRDPELHSGLMLITHDGSAPFFDINNMWETWGNGETTYPLYDQHSYSEWNNMEVWTLSNWIKAEDYITLQLDAGKLDAGAKVELNRIAIPYPDVVLDISQVVLTSVPNSINLTDLGTLIWVETDGTDTRLFVEITNNSSVNLSSGVVGITVVLDTADTPVHVHCSVRFF